LLWNNVWGNDFAKFMEMQDHTS